MTTQKFFPYAQQWIDETDIAAVSAALQEPLITRGPKVEEWEVAIAKECQALYAVAFSSATAALHGAYWAAGVTPFDRIITSPNTFIGTVAGALTVGAEVDLADIDPQTGNLDVDRMLTPRPRTKGKLVFVPVHFRGDPLDMHRFSQTIIDPNAVVIEDASQAFGATYTNQKKVGCCQYSDMTVFSFHPIKTITTGEGGMVVTNDLNYCKQLRLFRNNGLEDGLVKKASGNYHITSFAAALGLSQLERLEAILRKRRSLIRLYRKLLASIPHLTLSPEESDERSSHNLFVVHIDFSAIGKSREEVRQALFDQGVGTQVHHTPLYHHPALKKSKASWDTLYPGMESYYPKALSLPLYPHLSEAHVKKIAAVVAQVLA
ncbi:MAG: DegT/DnrJ/EryC1/StrS family aminotransferase [Verrucomicrobia bacterium]|nr:DegT/DnrJ/EryC1/StrS family aminotransferase [Verrucomicrobiota bacterium]